MANTQISELATTKTSGTIDADAEYLAAEPVSGTSYKALITEVVAAGLAQATAAIDVADDVDVAGVVEANGFYTATTGVIASNGVWSAAVGVSDAFVCLISRTGSTPSGITQHRTTASAAANVLVSTSNIEVSTSVLTGTTGSSSKVTVSLVGGTVYVENRFGYSVRFVVVVLGA